MDDPLQSLTAERERVIHKLPNFLLSTGIHACGKRKPQASAMKAVEIRDWRDRLDDRIDRCPGCDEWRWDKRCSRCNTTPANDDTEATS
jgi:hypothetical protein